LSLAEDGPGVASGQSSIGLAVSSRIGSNSANNGRQYERWLLRERLTTSLHRSTFLAGVNCGVNIYEGEVTHEQAVICSRLRAAQSRLRVSQ
jgi:hypothetical protein